MSKILVLDNYDSFVYNLVHLLRELGEFPDIVRNDKISLEAVNEYDKILLSPGPGIPNEAGLMPQIISKYASSKSIFGVCLGHQAIAENFGASLHNLPEVLHGLSSQVDVTDTTSSLFNTLPKQFQVGHYHSWVVEEASLPKTLKVIARDERGNLMAIQHQTLKVWGVQFHPESILTENGKSIIRNWLES